MLKTHIRAGNLCWDTAGRLLDGPVTSAEHAAQLSGRFATATCENGQIVLARDVLGLNKIFFATGSDGTTTAATYVADLTRQGIALADVYSVPAGAVVTIDAAAAATRVARFGSLPASAGSAAEPDRVLARIRDELHTTMSRLAAAHPGRSAVVCLSGGADSTLIALYARQHFPRLSAITYTHHDVLSDDAVAAQATAAELGVPWRLVSVSDEDILAAITPALTFGQDWRDFNVHAAIVNHLLGMAIAEQREQPLVLTGDLMNEVLGDYAPVRYRDIDYYRLPAQRPDLLRVTLTRGIQAGDREVGIFASHGLSVAQPFSWSASALLELPSHMTKARIMADLGGGQLPEAVLRRDKVRAQIGDTEPERGILPLLVRTGRTQGWLEQQFCDILGAASPAQLRQFIRAGIYRPAVPTRMERHEPGLD